MTEKRTFPGALSPEQREMLARQQAEQQRKAERKAQESADKTKTEKQRRDELVKMFLPKFSSKAAGITVGVLFVVNYAIGGLDRAFSDFYTDTNFSTEVTVQTGPELGPAIREAYDPYYHGAYPSGMEMDVNSKYWKDHKAYRGGNINSRWKRHIVLLAIEAFVLANFLSYKLQTKRNVREDVDTLLEIERLAKEHKVSPDMVKRMLLVTPEIVQHMATESRVYFDLLMSSDIDYEMNPTVFTVASSILEGHLQSHPEDLKKVLEVFDRESLPERVFQATKTQNIH